MSLLIPRAEIYLAGPVAALPSRMISNEDFFRWAGLTTALRTRTQWVEANSGIRTRYWVDADQSCADLAEQSIRNFLAAFPAARESIRNVILSTSSPDHVSPPTSPSLQFRLGLENVGCFDMGAACAGFVSGVHIASGLAVATGQSQLLVSADVRSKFLNPEDLRVSPLFGDGAVSCLLSSDPAGARLRLLASKTAVDGSIADAVSIPAGGSKLPAAKNTDPQLNYIRMKDGPEIFARAVHGIVEITHRLMRDLSMKPADVDWFVPHQGNLHLIRQAASLLGIAKEKTVETVQKYGNTSGSSTGLALAELLGSGVLKSGQKVLLSASGGGGVGAAALLEVL